MSPPTKMPEAPELDRKPAEPADGPGPAPVQRAPAVAPPQAAVLRGQQTAGNQAMASVFAAPAGIQRAPKDEDPRISGLATGPTLDDAGGVATARTLPGTDQGDRRRSGLATGPTLDDAGGVATARTLPGTDRGDPRRSGMAYSPTIDSSGGLATGPTLAGPAPGAGPGAPAPVAPPGPGPGPAPGGGPGGPSGPGGPDDDAVASLPGVVPQGPAKGPARSGPAMGYTDASIASAYARDPTLVHRAVNWTWYAGVLDSVKFTGDYPRGVRIGNAVVVAPDYDGPGPPPRTDPIVEPDPDGKLGPNDPIPGDPRLYQGPRQQQPDLTDPNAKRALFPGSRRGEEPGMKPSVPLTHDEVMRAYRDNPGSVHFSDSDEWHDQVYRLDRGQGPVPRAYRSGNTIIVDPSYPVNGRPPDSSPRGSVYQPGPGWDLGTVLNPVKVPTDPKEKARILADPVEGPKLRQKLDSDAGVEHTEHIDDAKKATAAIEKAKKEPAVRPTPPTPAPAPPDTQLPAQTIAPSGYVPQEKKPAKWDVKGGEISRETSDEGKRVTDKGTETQIKSRKQSVGLAKGYGYEAKQRDESQEGDKFTAKEKSHKVNLGLGGPAYQQTNVIEKGTGPDGPKSKRETSKGGSIGPEGATGTASTAYTTAGGTKAEGKGDVKIGPDGSVQVTGTGTITTPGGFTGHLSVSKKIGGIVAKDPVELPNGKFAVDYIKTDEGGSEIGGGYSKPGGAGPTIGGTYGTTTSTSNSGRKVFDSKDAAVAFQLAAAMQLASPEDDLRNASTVEGALKMKDGEIASVSETDTDTLGGSFGMSQVSVGVAKSDATTTALQIEKREGSKVRITPSIAEQSALNASISVAGQAGNTKGSSETNSFAVTYEFDLGTDVGKQAFKQYLRQRLPPPMPPGAKWIDSTTGHAIEDHDVYNFAHIGKIGWGTHATQTTVEDESGKHTTAVGGQSETVELNRWRWLTMDKNRQANADIITKMDNDQIATISAQMTVGGEDGEFNREQFRKIFSDKGAPAGTSPTTSGEWTLTADIDKKMFEQFEKTNKDALKAKTRDERLKLYSEAAQKNGAAMLGGQVRGSGRKLAWNLELKGDPNFPGPAGRQMLNQQRAKLAAQLKERPDTAGSIASEAKDVLNHLANRLKAVSDKTKYTDLPDELRDEQGELINTHIAEFKSLRSQALSLEMRGGRKEDFTDVLLRASKEDGYKDFDMKDRAWRFAQDLVTIHETELGIAEKEIIGTRDLVQQVFGGAKDVRWGKDIKKEAWVEHNAKAKEKYELAKAMGPRLTQATIKMREIKEKWAAEPDPKKREDILREYDSVLLSTLDLMTQQGLALRDTAREAFPVTSASLTDNPKYAKLWEVIQVDRAERTSNLAQPALVE